MNKSTFGSNLNIKCWLPSEVGYSCEFLSRLWIFMVPFLFWNTCVLKRPKATLVSPVCIPSLFLPFVPYSQPSCQAGSLGAWAVASTGGSWRMSWLPPCSTIVLPLGLDWWNKPFPYRLYFLWLLNFWGKQHLKNNWPKNIHCWIKY